MESLIITTEQELRKLIRQELDNFQPTSTPPLEPVRYLYSILELANFLKCSPVTAQKLKNSGKIRFSQFGRKCVFRTDEILQDLAQ